jgi:ABC-2 type transport system permease protein
MRTVWCLIVKEFQQFRRDPKMFPIVFVAPILQLIILGYAANMDVESIPTALLDRDRTPQSRALAEAFGASGHFVFTAAVETEDELDRLMDSGSASMGLVIPKGYADDLAAGRTAAVQWIADGSDTTAATSGLNYASAIAANHAAKMLEGGNAGRREGSPNQPEETANLATSSAFGLQPSALSHPPSAGIAAVMRIWYNPDLKSRVFMVPGVLGLLLMVVTMMLTSLAIVKEREVGTMEQIIVTPIRPWQFIAGKLTPYTLMGLVDMILVLLVTTLWFRVPVRGSWVLLVALTMAYLLTTLGLGLLVSTVSRTQQQAMMTAAFFVMMPMIYLSGFVFPIANMPAPIQAVTYALPLRYYFVIVRGIFLKGAGLPDLWDEAAAMVALGAVIFTLAAMRFQKRIG